MSVRSLATPLLSFKCGIAVRLAPPKSGPKLSRLFAGMSSVGGDVAALDGVPSVEIDGEGKFKYILVRVTTTAADVGEGGEKIIVRGNKEAAFHPDIFAKVDVSMKELGLASAVLGGGKILHEPQNRSIKVFSKSTGFGRADHALTCQLLKAYLPDYSSISWSDDD